MHPLLVHVFIQAEPSKKLNNFLSLGMRVDLNYFLVDPGANMANFQKKIETFIFQKKKSEFTTENFRL